MSETTRSRLKVSREGVVLIKSFEGFRPRAVLNEEGRWTLGYGHTASAREGLTVGEQDAELLLQYDLLPVVKALNEQVSIPLNQHQFDALASFAISVGVDRFLASDVLQRLNAGRAGEAADALFDWPEPPAPDSALRRRAAERALFVADPQAPIHLADLLAAPLPPPRAMAASFDTRAAAVAALLGEPAEPDESASGPQVEAPPAPEAAEQYPRAAAEAPRAEPESAWAVQPAPHPAEPLVLTPAVESDFAGLGQEPREAEQPAAAPQDETGLFEDEASLSVLRHESGPAPSGRFDWGETGAFLIMGLVGLGACAAAAASFRKAMTDDSFIGDFTIIGWVLALIGLTCVGVSSWNLYRRWGRRD